MKLNKQKIVDKVREKDKILENTADTRLTDGFKFFISFILLMIPFVLIVVFMSPNSKQTAPTTQNVTKDTPAPAPVPTIIAKTEVKDYSTKEEEVKKQENTEVETEKAQVNVNTDINASEGANVTVNTTINVD